MVAAVLANKADFGIALDGDGDRLVMVDHKGEIVDGDELIYIIAKSRLDAEKMHKAIQFLLKAVTHSSITLQVKLPLYSAILVSSVPKH